MRETERKVVSRPEKRRAAVAVALVGVLAVHLSQQIGQVTWTSSRSRSLPNRPRQQTQLAAEVAHASARVRIVAALGAAVALPLSAPEARAEDDEVELYVGAGDFRRLQHDLVIKEASALGRRGLDITSVTGYAGSNKVAKGDKLCGGDADKFGHAKVVQLTIPQASLQDFVELFLELVSKRDQSRNVDKGQFGRPVIGLEGGLNSPLMSTLEKASKGRYSFEPGQGADPDVPVGKVYVYDSRKFRFRPAELSNQFANVPQESYTSDYFQLNQVQSFIGRISFTQCL
mmetsp:Transcript_73206/g.136802  ORF Transcript_73206/g.136802 Transcript_73206/m.136802 type:complete len:287 (+) Transcript_73206:33-893(+)